jgi:hypothetical protein
VRDFRDTIEDGEENFYLGSGLPMVVEELKEASE